MTSIDKALKILRTCPRVSAGNVSDLPRSVPPKYHGLSRKKLGLGNKGQSHFQAWPPLGSLKDKLPFYLSVPREPYNQDLWRRRSLQRISLLDLQRLVDLNRIDANKPVDLTSLCNTKLFGIDVDYDRTYGFHLTDEGADSFITPLNIEVQYASESVIAAIERVGGVITTRFYDLYSIWAMQNPSEFFKRGLPIPKCKMPPQDAMAHYTDPETRGYLADPKAIQKARTWLGQKYGYAAPSLDSEEQRQLMLMRKDPRQSFFGLNPGSVVSLADRLVLKPLDNKLQEFYDSS